MFFEFFRECVYIMHITIKFKRYGNNKYKEEQGDNTAAGH